jgi:D-arabinose 1-dehydrogenase-like Zn-dependent alcohol dehydrogenase
LIVGLFGGEFRMPMPSIPLKLIRIAGSYVGSLNQLRELVALAQTVKLPEIPLDFRPLNMVNESLDDLAQGRVIGRVVLQP